MQIGQWVTLSSAIGNIRRQILQIKDGVLLISWPEEIEAAKKDGREPLCIGFPESDVVSVG